MSALDAKLPLSPAEHTLLFINSLTMQLVRLRKSPLLREVIRQAGNVWTSHPERVWRVFPELEAAWRLVWVYAGGLDTRTHFVWNYHKGVFAYSQPAGLALLDTVFPAPSTFLQEAPLLAQLDDAFPLTPLNPHPQPKGEPNRQPCQCGHSTWLAFLHPGPNPQTQEKPELAQLASARASCPSVCGWASC